MKILVTGGAGFIGSAVIRFLIENTESLVLNLDKLTYAGNLESLDHVNKSPRYIFKKVDICFRENVERVFEEFQPDLVMHLAAESHVDRSINDSSVFINTNIIGTYTLLEVCRDYWEKLSLERKARFRFHHISTDEVYGDLGEDENPFTELSPYAPSSPYSASKAASDHLVRAWMRTYGLPIIVSNCSNNYGPYHFPEKLIPKIIINALEGKSLPVYGDGRQVRDWLYVEDHAKALYLIISSGKVGETYNIGGNSERSNIEVVRTICTLLDKLVPCKPVGINSYSDLITFITDRPGHDARYAIDNNKIKQDLGWTPSENFESGLLKTVQWYISNRHWWSKILDRNGF